MSVDVRSLLTALVLGASGAALALVTASGAAAEPAPPVIPPAPVDAPVAAPVDAPVVAAPPDGVPHLASPDALPPGSTMDRTVMGNESPNVSYLKDLWHAVQNQEISGKEALLLGIAQRGMNTPIPAQAPGPNVPVAGVEPAAAPVDPAQAAPLPANPLPANPLPPTP